MFVVEGVISGRFVGFSAIKDKLTAHFFLNEHVMSFAFTKFHNRSDGSNGSRYVLYLSW